MFWIYLFYFACTLPSFAWQLWLCFKATPKGRFAPFWVLGAAAVICLLICWNPGDHIRGVFLGNANLILAGFILLDMALFAIGVGLGWLVFAICKKYKNTKT